MSDDLVRRAAPLSRGTLSADADRRWMVLCTKARQEKAVARYLDARGLEYSLPLIDRVSYHRNRKFVSQVPLFTGYVFLRGTTIDRYGVVDTGRVSQVLTVHDQDRFRQELLHLEQAVTSGADLEIHPFAVVGRRCRVRRGPFEGIEGIVIERNRTNRLVLQIDILGRGASLEIDIDLLEPID